MTTDDYFTYDPDVDDVQDNDDDGFRTVDDEQPAADEGPQDPDDPDAE